MLINSLFEQFFHAQLKLEEANLKRDCSMKLLTLHDSHLLHLTKTVEASFQPQINFTIFLHRVRTIDFFHYNQHWNHFEKQSCNGQYEQDLLQQAQMSMFTWTPDYCLRTALEICDHKLEALGRKSRGTVSHSKRQTGAGTTNTD